MLSKLRHLKTLSMTVNFASNYVGLCGFAILGTSFFTASSSTLLSAIVDNKAMSCISLLGIPFAAWYVPAACAARQPVLAQSLHKYIYGSPAYDWYTYVGIRDAVVVLELAALVSYSALAYTHFGGAKPAVYAISSSLCELMSPQTAPLFSIVTGLSIVSTALWCCVKGQPNRPQLVTNHVS